MTPNLLIYLCNFHEWGQMCVIYAPLLPPNFFIILFYFILFTPLLPQAHTIGFSQGSAIFNFWQDWKFLHFYWNQPRNGFAYSAENRPKITYFILKSVPQNSKILSWQSVLKICIIAILHLKQVL